MSLSFDARAWLALSLFLNVAAKVAHADDESDASVETQARAAEEAAFAAIEKEHWCEALGLFLRSDALAPQPDLLFNAAQAAEYADDRKRAVMLYEKFLGDTKNAERRAEAKKKLSAMKKKLDKNGPGTECPAELVGDASKKPPDATPPDTTAGGTGATGDNTSSGGTGSADAAAAGAGAAGASTGGTASSTDPAGGAAEGKSSLRPLAWGFAGVGALTGVAGGVLATIGAMPWFQHADANAKLEAAAQSGAPAKALRQQLDQSRKDWQTYGAASVTGGIVMISVGAAALIAGVAGGLLLADEPPPAAAAAASQAPADTSAPAGAADGAPAETAKP